MWLDPWLEADREDWRQASYEAAGILLILAVPWLFFWFLAGSWSRLCEGREDEVLLVVSVQLLGVLAIFLNEVKKKTQEKWRAGTKGRGQGHLNFRG